MEPVVLRVLNWRLHAVTPFAWLKVFLKKAALLMYEEFQRRAGVLLESASSPCDPKTFRIGCGMSGMKQETKYASSRTWWDSSLRFTNG